jgi:hypothetical protein
VSRMLEQRLCLDNRLISWKVVWLRIPTGLLRTDELLLSVVKRRAAQGSASLLIYFVASSSRGETHSGNGSSCVMRARASHLTIATLVTCQSWKPKSVLPITLVVRPLRFHSRLNFGPATQRPKEANVGKFDLSVLPHKDHTEFRSCLFAGITSGLTIAIASPRRQGRSVD